MGQYNVVRSCTPDSSLTIVIIGNIMNAIGLNKLWRTLWHAKHVNSKKEIMACVVQWLDKQDRFEDLARGMRPRLGPELKEILHGPFQHAILQLHLFTDYHVRRLTNQGRSHLVDICEEISNYMLYLLVVNPSMLPVSFTEHDTFALFPEKIFSTSKEHLLDVLHEDYRVGHIEGKILLGARALLDSELSSEELMVEIKEIWIRLLVYAAGKSHAEAHVQQMSKGGGELLTFVWLLMGAHYQLGDVARRLDLISSSSHTGEGDRLFAFNFPSNEQPTHA